MTETPLDRAKFRRWVVIILVVGIGAVFLWMVREFLIPVLLAAVFSALVTPVFIRFVRLFRGRRALASLATTTLVFVVLVAPLAVLCAVVANQTAQVADKAAGLLEKALDGPGQGSMRWRLVEHFPALAEFIPSEEKLEEGMAEQVGKAGSALMVGAGTVVAKAGKTLLSLFVFLFAMFYFLIDGKRVLGHLIYLIPLEREEEGVLIGKFVSVTRAMIKGTLVVGVVQAVLGAGAFYIAGFGATFFWGGVLFLLSVVPGIGAGLLGVPATIYLFLQDRPVAAVAMGVWFLVVVATVDNILRPILVGKDTRMPDILILVGMLGGIFTFGPVGFLVGPIICALFISACEIYGVTFRNVLDQNAQRTPAPPVEDAGEVPPSEAEA